jgi:hypothetical protein
VLDARADELGRAQAESPEAWVLRTLGPFPEDGSPAFQADWLGRAGRAASYREAAGITRPDMPTGPAPQGHPELAVWHAQTLRDLEIPDEVAQMTGMSQGELEAHVAAYERVQVTAPREVSAELRAERLAEADARARALELRAQSQPELAAQAEARAAAGGVRAVELESQAGIYADWEESTATQRHQAELAAEELERRAPGKRAPQPSQPETAASRALESPPITATLEREGATLREPTAEAKDQDVEAVAEGLDAEVDQLPELDTTTVSPATEARQAELAERRAAQAEAAQNEAQREANREAYAAAEAGNPSAWVPGPSTPKWGGLQASTSEPEAAEPEAGL